MVPSSVPCCGCGCAVRSVPGGSAVLALCPACWSWWCSPRPAALRSRFLAELAGGAAGPVPASSLVGLRVVRSPLSGGSSRLLF